MSATPPVGRCVGCFHDFRTGACGGCGAVDPDGPARLHLAGCILDPEHGAGCVRQQWATSDPDAPWNRVLPPAESSAS